MEHRSVKYCVVAGFSFLALANIYRGEPVEIYLYILSAISQSIAGVLLIIKN